jgi:M6 family metalloprotease-like protein
MREATAAVLLLLLWSDIARATPPPEPGTDPAILEGRDLSRFTFRRALKPLAEAARNNRQLAIASELGVSGADARPLGPTAVMGERSIPVLLVKYNDSGADLYPPANLERELFSEEWPDGCLATGTCTGTMREYYREISYGLFTVTGNVHGWTTLSKESSHYQGKDAVDASGRIKRCNGICQTNQVGDLITEAVDAHPEIAWEQFDNDGPDGTPNSGDDDGYVDFVAFVHPERGGECRDPANTNRAIWSHRFSLTSLVGRDLETTRPGFSGDPIRIDDYVIMPALACDNQTMIQIGVFAHEFGHAFGLPDLYDTTGKTSGLGNWCLMAAGSWGGDDQSPDRPTHMSAWAKNYLGWISVLPVTGDMTVLLDAVETNSIALRIPISTKQYYLVTNIRRQGFDSRLPADGLAVWKVNQSAIDGGMPTNEVNARANKGVELIQADGLRQLENPANRGDAGDLFSGPHTRFFDNFSRPASLGRTAICDIGDPDDPLSSRISVSSGRCTEIQPAPELLQDPAAPAAESIRGLLAEPTGSVEGDQPVRVTGTLLSSGASPRRDARRVVLEDAEGRKIEVLLPSARVGPQTDAPQVGTPPGSVRSRVEVTGRIRRNPDGTVSLQATSAKVVKLEESGDGPRNP